MEMLAGGDGGDCAVQESSTESARAKEQRRLDLADFASACRLLLVGKIKNKF